jgi:hypothetical protein
MRKDEATKAPIPSTMGPATWWAEADAKRGGHLWIKSARLEVAFAGRSRERCIASLKKPAEICVDLWGWGDVTRTYFARKGVRFPGLRKRVVVGWAGQPTTPCNIIRRGCR